MGRRKWAWMDGYEQADGCIESLSSYLSGELLLYRWALSRLTLCVTLVLIVPKYQTLSCYIQCCIGGDTRRSLIGRSLIRAV